MEFAANSDFIATNIRATNTSCKMARRVVSQTIRRNDRTPLGYRCEAVMVDAEGLAYSRYTCKKRRAVVRWRQY